MGKACRGVTLTFRAYRARCDGAPTESPCEGAEAVLVEVLEHEGVSVERRLRDRPRRRVLAERPEDELVARPVLQRPVPRGSERELEPVTDDGDRGSAEIVVGVRARVVLQRGCRLGIRGRLLADEGA